MSALPQSSDAPHPLQILQEVWGYADFRGPQADIVEHVIDGGDALGLMPPGGGKAPC